MLEFWEKLKKQRTSLIRIFAVFLIFTTALGLLNVNPAMGNSNSPGFAQYSRGNFQGAIQAYTGELRAARGAAAKAHIHKMIGICHFNIGQNPAAQSSFAKAKSLNPQIAIQSSEVLDESVISFFNQIPGPAPTPRAVARQAPTRGAIAPNAKNAKTTKMLIQSNVSNATIMIQGIMAGTVGTEIEVDPGKTQITLTAKGYRTAVANAVIKPNQVNTYQVNMKKIAVKKPVVVKKAPKKVHKKRVAAKPKRAKQKTGLFAEDEQVTYQKPQGKSLADEFTADGTAPAQPQYVSPTQGQIYQQPAGQMQPAQPIYQQPVQPVYQQPVQPVYQQPVQPVYQQPSVPPQYAPAPPAPQLNAEQSEPSRRTNSSRRSDSKPNPVVAALPFGAGQFQNDSYFLGLALGAAQVGAIYMAYTSYADKEATIKETNDFTQLRYAEEETIPQADLAAHQDATNAYVADSNAYVEDQKQKMYIWTGVFVGVYALSVTEAFINMPKPLKKKKKRRRGFRGFSYLDYIDPDRIEYKNLYNGKTLMVEKQTKPDFRYQLLPSPRKPNSNKGGIILHMQWKY